MLRSRPGSSRCASLLKVPAPGRRHAQADGGLLGLPVDLGELILGAGEADFESFDLTEPALALGLGEGRHPDADRIEQVLLAEGKAPAQARRATVLGRPIEHNQSAKTDKAKERKPWLAMDLVFRAPPTVHIAGALMDDETRRVLELCQDIARDKTLEWLEDAVAEIRWKSGGKKRARVRDGLIVAVFRHYESRAADSRPLLHDHAVVSTRARRPDGTWGNQTAGALMKHIVAADALYTLLFMEEVSARLGWAWEPREATPGRRPVMEIAGIDQRLICWQSTRRQQIADALPLLTANYEERQGHPPGERAAYALACKAADQTRSPKRTQLRSLSELRAAWRESAARAYGADIVAGLAERARAAAAAIWARVRPVVDVALAVAETIAVVYVMRGAFARRHLLAEARRHLSYALRGRPHRPGLDEEIVQAAIDGYARRASRRMLTSDLRALCPRDTEDQAVLRALTRKRAASLYERARLAAGGLTARVRAARRADRLNSRPRRHTVAVPGTLSSRTGRRAGRDLEATTDVAAVELTSRTLESAAAEMAARLQAGVRERAAARLPSPKSAAAPPPSAQQPVQPAQGRTPNGGIA
ncbi:MobF family relaxase [Streptomyces goshikiensis]|uniref:MobF family relaxase n=1 Tax=Streptomyces goshikiensis TaxID=1942 RepID=UPI00380DF66D